MENKWKHPENNRPGMVITESNFMPKDIHGIPDIQIQEELRVGLENLKKKDMENKYFTPSIEDIRVGYECEVNMGLIPGFREGWNKEILNQENTAYYLKFGSAKSMFRVPYLTKEQIEAEGWIYTEYTTVYGFHKTFYKVVDHYGVTREIELRYNYETYFLSLEYDCGDRCTLYEGECRCINDFRLIMKMLKIK